MECGVWSVECGVWSVERGVWRVERDGVASRLKKLCLTLLNSAVYKKRS